MRLIDMIAARHYFFELYTMALIYIAQMGAGLSAIGIQLAPQLSPGAKATCDTNRSVKSGDIAVAF